MRVTHPSRFIIVVGCLGLMAAFAVLAGDEAQAAVGCGDTITTDTTLHQDLVNCPNNGIIIDADNVSLDLNGHLVDGDGIPAAGCDPGTEFCDEGLAALNHDGVTIKSGRVREFGDGVAVGRARHVRLLSISSSKNTFFGIVLFRAARSLVRGSSGNRNPAPDGDGMGLFSSHRVRVLNNSFRRNAEPGLHLAFDSGHNLIKGNVFGRNAPAVLVEKADRNRILGNRFVRNGASVVVASGSANVIARNHILKGQDGIAIEKGHRNLVSRNVIDGPRQAGIYLALNRPSIGGHDNLVRRNLVRGSGENAFLVRAADRHSRLKGNIAIGAGNDGFDIESRSAKLTRNRANHNHDLGIRAVRGVIDGGGNVARHNGDPRQCTNIVCS